ncbi:hypothetical protein [Deinococcus knuensis]|uniref:Lipoprotein n=1 Tax=Deinococcus knuensis TaxID=1837380 RepID=A0ABQ2SI18_9DEIO|nr:hypothetical protein [Deinococcus knuensis]GGS29357.1 hypothetical protein GCM10008961_21260 [Deinococcus knuensis]
MSNRVNLMCALALTAGLASCAPTMQGPGGPIRPRTQTGLIRLFVKVVPVAALDDTTPADAYVSFPECLGTVVAVPDVRRLGVVAATDACRRTDGSVVAGVVGLAVAAGLLLTFLALQLFNMISQVIS